jgi:hypothetical protein
VITLDVRIEVISSHDVTRTTSQFAIRETAHGS